MNRLPARVIAVERYGDRGDALLSIDGISDRVVVRSGAMDLPEEGEYISVSVDPDHTHLFEPGECGNRL